MRVRNIALAAAGATLITGAAVVATATASTRHAAAGKLPTSAIEKIVGADGELSDGVLTIDISRDDLHAKGPDGTSFKPGFQLQHELAFQSVGPRRAVLNGDLALKPAETQKVIDALLANHLRFQAFHQHLYDMSPLTWFIHFRGVAAPQTLAREIRAVIDRTGTELPQSSPPNPTTPLPANRLAQVLGGSATVGENGIVTVDVPRRHGVRLGGVEVSPDLNIATNVQFQPLAGGRAAVVPDFSMTANEIDRVTARMRGYGWDVGCLYNQEVNEHPQLYFAHMYKAGDAVTLARQIRRGLDLTASTH